MLNWKYPISGIASKMNISASLVLQVAMRKMLFCSISVLQWRLKNALRCTRLKIQCWLSSLAIRWTEKECNAPCVKQWIHDDVSSAWCRVLMTSQMMLLMSLWRMKSQGMIYLGWIDDAGYHKDRSIVPTCGGDWSLATCEILLMATLWMIYKTERYPCAHSPAVLIVWVSYQVKIYVAI